MTAEILNGLNLETITIKEAVFACNRYNLIVVCNGGDIKFEEIYA